MPYPNKIDTFIRKLNKNDAGYVIEDEVLVISDGVFEGELAHDNVKNESVMIFTAPQMAGERIFNFFLSIPSETPWKRSIKVFSATPKVYVTYETLGDQVEAEDINRVQDSIVATQLELESYKNSNALALSEKADNARVLTNVPANAKFTDTTYSEITEAEINAGTASTLRTITARRVKFILDKVQGWINALSKTDIGLGNVDNIQQATKTEFNAHNSDTTRHITAAERTAWGNKWDYDEGAIKGVKVNNAGDADTVNGKTVGADVPANAKFTDTVTTINGKTGAIAKADIVALGIPAQDTVYTHPANHPASIITQDSNNRFVTDTEKANWNGKQDALGFTPVNTSDSRLSDSRKCDNTFDSAATSRTNLGLTGNSNTTHYHDGRYIAKTNTTAFTPTADHHPATKKYVDDKAAAFSGPLTWNNLKGVT